MLITPLNTQSWDISVQEWEVSQPSTHCHPHLPFLGMCLCWPKTTRGGSTLLSLLRLLLQPGMDKLSFPWLSPPPPSTADSGHLSGVFLPVFKMLTSPSGFRSPTSLSKFPGWSLLVLFSFSAWRGGHAPGLTSSLFGVFICHSHPGATRPQSH